MSAVEGLEARRHLSTVIFDGGSLNGGVLNGGVTRTVLGRKNRADEIVVGRDPRRASKILVTVNGEGQKFAVVGRFKLEILGRGGDDHVVVDKSVTCDGWVDGGAGNDVIEIRATQPEPSGALGWYSSGWSADGGAGDDLVSGGTRAAALSGGDGNDTLTSGTGGDSLFGGWGDDSLVGGGGGGGSGAAGTPRPFLEGGSGNDVLRAGAGAALGSDLFGGPGSDTLYSAAATDALSGGRGDDSLVGNGSGGASFDGGVGSDTILGTAGNDTILGGMGNDQVDGRAGGDRIDGDTGWLLNAWDLTGPLDDTLLGGDGEDTIYGNSGNDRVDGGNSHDLLGGDQGDDQVLGGAGDDVLSGDTEGGRALRVQWSGIPDWGNDSLDGGAGNDWLVGNSYHDHPYDAPREHDTLTGGAGADVIDAYVIEGDVLTDRGAGDFVPADALAWADVPEPTKRITVSVALPDAGEVYPTELPWLMYSAAGLAFTSSGQPEANQIAIGDTPGRPFLLRDFFVAWAMPIDGKTLGRFRITSATVNGVERADIATYAPKDGDVINIRAE